MAWVRVPWRRLLVTLTAGSAIGVPMFGLFMLAMFGFMEPEDDLVEVVGAALAGSVGYCLLISVSTLPAGHILLRMGARHWSWFSNLTTQFALGVAIGFLMGVVLIGLGPALMILGPFFMAPLSGGVTMTVWAGMAEPEKRGAAKAWAVTRGATGPGFPRITLALIRAGRQHNALSIGDRVYDADAHGVCCFLPHWHCVD